MSENTEAPTNLIMSENTETPTKFVNVKSDESITECVISVKIEPPDEDKYECIIPDIENVMIKMEPGLEPEKPKHTKKKKQNSANIPQTCNECGREFKNKIYLRRHELIHEREDISCPLCYLVCKNKYLLKTHQRRHHGDQDLEAECPHCDRVCTTKALLRLHIKRMHTTRIKKFVCDVCQRSYYSKGELRSHITWAHSPGGGHACFCGRVFRTPARLRDHARRHHVHAPLPRDHVCRDCGKGFTTKQVLNRHIKGHTGITYPCRECGLQFRTESYVKIHHKLKHLKMTRAEIKAQRKPRVLPHVPEGSKPNLNKIAKLMSEKLAEMKKETKQVRKEVASIDLQIPLFETFVDIQRE